VTVSEWLVKGVTCSNLRHDVVVYPQALAGLADDQADRPCGSVALARQIAPLVFDEFLLKAERGHVMPPNIAGRVLRKFKPRPDRRLSDEFAEPLVLQPQEGSSPEEMGGTWPMPLAWPGQATATPSGN
jgi:hypothetical protein